MKMKIIIKIAAFALIAIFIAFITYSVVVYYQSGIEEHGLALEEKAGYRAVHWHSKISMLACGKRLKLPLNRGTPLLHTHRDPTRIHIEGLIKGLEDATLGKFMNAIAVPFSNQQLFSYKVGDSCPGSNKPSTLKMRVNGQPNDLFTNYPLNDGDIIELIYD